MNSQATSVTAWRGHRPAIAARLLYLREIDRTAFWDFCNSIPLRADIEGVLAHHAAMQRSDRYSRAVSRYHSSTPPPSLMLVGFDSLPCYWPALATREGTARSALQIIFSFEPRSDLLDHFATIGVVC
jgi:hypothetical protein